MIKLRIEQKEDRESLAVILFRNGYTVKQVKIRRTDGKNRYNYYVCIEENENENQNFDN